MKKRSVSMLLCMGMATSMLAGCGSKTVDATTADDTAKKTEKVLARETVYDSNGKISRKCEYDA